MQGEECCDDASAAASTSDTYDGSSGQETDSPSEQQLSEMQNDVEDAKRRVNKSDEKI